MLATFLVWLNRFTRQEDIVVGTPVSNRERVELQSLMGYFLNTLPLRTRVSSQQSFRDILVQVRRTVLGGLEHADLPFEEIAELTGIKRDGFQTPVYQVAFVLVEQGMPVCQLGSASARAEEFHTGTSKHDLILNVIAEGEAWVCDLEYASDLYTADGAKRMAADWVELTRSIVADPDRSISGLRTQLDAMLSALSPTPNVLPLTPNQKVERPSVEELAGGGMAVRASYAAPRTELEGRLVEVWQGVLRQDESGSTTTFFMTCAGTRCWLSNW